MEGLLQKEPMMALDQSSQYQSSQFRQFVDVPLGEIRQNPGQRSIPNEDITALANAMALWPTPFASELFMISG